ncbi:flavin-binding monooxygenase-like protein [Talaromyces proteolyticus]|uniref:Flavin-binding monooxygenase-like protein n=1 Tax=Talaromyces proteolyticus TaxID=1131652 RepID=A0AAD4KM56_9EURO|nr:flavin-binding monooxygenase-like protein [Talaromyces proteolyticus]KAH8692316.1 flavin-binding monooxygenase-like protein [Talaromyces proteolyticus]
MAEAQHEQLDVVIIGGGVGGICSLRANILSNPSASIALLESQSSLGGVWARERIYAGLKSNNVIGNYEFSDFLMDPSKFKVKAGQHIPGEIVNEYLTSYCEHFGLGEYIRLDRNVESVTRRVDSDSWVVKIHNESRSAIETIEARKLIVATGLTSQAYLPTITGQESFSRPLFHIADLKRRESEIVNASAKRTTVLGSAKSAFDAAYLLADAGLPVDMIIRASGHGPSWMAPVRVTPLKKLLEKLLNTRLLTWFSPCIWGDSDGYPFIRRLLHSTWLGRKIVDAFWWILGNDVITLNQFDSHPETAKLKPWVGPLWIGSGLSILNYDHDLLDMVRNGKIKIHVADIERLSEGTIHLSTGDTLPSDGMVCCTGWRARPNIKFLPDGIEDALGLPTANDPLTGNMIRTADAYITKQLPKLKEQPDFNPHFKLLNADSEVSHPLRLYRFMIPCSSSLALSRSIAFVGMVTSASTILLTQAQALWASAYLNGTLSIPAEEEMQWSTALHTQYCKLRYGVGANGKRNPDFAFDTLPYVDMLLNDLGLKWKRKESTLKEWLDPYGVEDYRGLVEEYLEKLKEDKKHI